MLEMPAVNKVEAMILATQMKLLIEEKFYLHCSVKRV
jgi:hypothetical protein